MAQPGVTLLVWREAGERFALPVSEIERAVPMAAVTVAANNTPGLLGMIDIGGNVMPVLSFAAFYRGSPFRALYPSQVLLVTRSGKHSLALVAEEVCGVTVVRPEQLVEPETIAPSLRGINAVLKESNGLVLVPDLECIFAPGPDRPLHSGMLAAA